MCTRLITGFERCSDGLLISPASSGIREQKGMFASRTFLHEKHFCGDHTTLHMIGHAIHQE